MRESTSLRLRRAGVGLIGVALVVTLAGWRVATLRQTDPVSQQVRGTEFAPSPSARPAEPPRYKQPANDKKPAKHKAVLKRVKPGPPIKLRFLRFGITAPIGTAVVENKLLYPPPNPAEVGWWPGGSMPGAKRGNAIMIGHAYKTGYSPLNVASRALSRTSKGPRLKAGDVIEVKVPDGLVRYKVMGFDKFLYADFGRKATGIIAPRFKRQLTIITCFWDKQNPASDQKYDSNIVVYAAQI